MSVLRYLMLIELIVAPILCASESSVAHPGGDTTNLGERPLKVIWRHYSRDTTIEYWFGIIRLLLSVAHPGGGHNAHRKQPWTMAAPMQPKTHLKEETGAWGAPAIKNNNFQYVWNTKLRIQCHWLAYCYAIWWLQLLLISILCTLIDDVFNWWSIIYFVCIWYINDCICSVIDECTFVLHEIADYFVRHNLSMYIVFLDATAFNGHRCCVRCHSWHVEVQSQYCGEGDMPTAEARQVCCYEHVD